MLKKVFAKDIIDFLGNEVISTYGPAHKSEIRYLKDIDNTDKYTLDWINPARLDKQKLAESARASVLLTDKTVFYNKNLEAQQKVLIHVNNPRLAIAKAGAAFFAKSPVAGFHPTAVVNPQAKIGCDVYIGAHACIGACCIGNHVQIHENAIIADDVIVEDEVIIQAGVMAGVDGLGCEREIDGILVKFPHFGKVIIEKKVDLGAGTIIAKGSLSDTVIGCGTKINAGCFIAHNTKIGANVWLSPKVNIAGSVKIGNNATIFSGVIIREQRIIGDYVTVGMGSVVTKDIPAGETWVGNPAKKLEKKYD